jgi:hypothetical protein
MGNDDYLDAQSAHRLRVLLHQIIEAAHGGHASPRRNRHYALCIAAQIPAGPVHSIDTASSEPKIPRPTLYHCMKELKLGKSTSTALPEKILDIAPNAPP